jgi:hypothetical protein
MDFFHLAGGSPEERKTSAFERMTAVAVPWLTLLVAILALVGKPSPVVWAVFGLALLVLAMGMYPALKAAMRRRIERAKDARAAKRAFPKFRTFVHRFGAFVDTRFGNTLHYILESELCQGRGDQFDRLGIPNLQFWYGFSQHFIARVDRQRVDVAEFMSALQDFYYLVGVYNNYCVASIFERFPRDLQEALTPKVKSSLNGFQQRFVRFLQDCQEFLTELAESRPAFNGLPRSFSLPKPL